ncbi:MAG: hypothetical protein ACP5M0_14330 [Desulfomonilaceae bacterium]
MKKQQTDAVAARPRDDRLDKTFQQEAFEYVAKWCRTSREFMNRRLERWKLLEDLYHNRRDLNSWSLGRTSSRADGWSNAGSMGEKPPSRWQSDIVLAPSYIVDTWADRAYQAIFSGPEWLTVVPDGQPASCAQGEEDFPTSYKLQELLLNKLAQGQIHVRIYEVLQHLVLYGTVYAKIFWYSKGIVRRRWDYETLDVVHDRGNIYDCPIVQVIPLDRTLPDWKADHGDVQRFEGIGHLVNKSHTYILEQFARKVYHLNKKAFLSRWPDAGEAELGATGGSDGLDDNGFGALGFAIWEWHGRIPSQGRYREWVCTIVTEQGAESPEDGVMVRLRPGPVLWSGLRPFLSAQYTPLPGPLGIGAVEGNLDLIHSISQFLSQSQDNTRLTANAQLIVRRGSSAARQMSMENEAVYPGKIWMVDDPDDIRPFPPLNFPQHEVNYLIDYLNSLLERRTSVSEITLGVSTRDKTATEAHILQESAQSPFATRTDLFARSFLENMGKIALSMLQQFVLEDQTITARDLHGRDVALTIRPNELQDGRYRVVATLTRQDSTRLAKAQSIERVLPTLSRFKPLLEQEGVQISLTELIKRYLDLVGVDGADRVFHRIGMTRDPDNCAPRVSSADGWGRQRPDDEDPIPADDLPETAAPPALVKTGGPMGRFPSDCNALAQLLGLQAMERLPQPPQ